MGDNTRPFLQGEEIDQLLRQGLTETEIAAVYNVTVAAVSKARRYEGGVARRNRYLTPSEQARELFPWRRVGKGPGGNSHNDYRALKAHSIWQVRHREDDLGPDQLQRLIRFYRSLITEGLIVEYRPTIPPGTGSSFTRSPRQPEDGLLLVRQNEWTDLADVARHEHWSYPTRLPRGAEDVAALLDSKDDG